VRPGLPGPPAASARRALPVQVDRAGSGSCYFARLAMSSIALNSLPSGPTMIVS
jgi:hypothetical protein